MNWKLLLIALSLIVGTTTARPADEKSNESTTLKAAPETTTALLEASASTTEFVTKRVSEKVTTAATTEVPPTVRYFMATHPTKPKPTNIRNKYANNYANLITKYTLNNNRNISNADGNNISLDNSNMFVSMHGVVVGSSLPDATVSPSTATSNSSSKPLVFIDADVSPTITTKRAFVTSNTKFGNGWSNYNLEPASLITARPKKPVIHKIISKWSDNPSDFYNNGQNSLTQTGEVNQLKDHLVQNAFNPMTTNFDQLPAAFAQHFIYPHTTTYKPTKRPITNIVHVYKKRPNTGSKKTNCRKVKIKFANGVVNKNHFASKEDCDFDVVIDNKIESTNSQSTTTVLPDYVIPNNDKFEDSATDEDYNYSYSGSSSDGDSSDTDEKLDGIENQVSKPGNNKVADGSDNKGHKKKKKPQSANQIDEDEDEGAGGIGGGAGVGSMVVTMMTMMAVFNPLNFGVWGILLAPLAAMLFGGMCFAMYSYMKHPMSKHYSSGHSHWPGPQEIIVKSKIRHSPIPIKIMHLHKHSSPPSKIVYTEPMHSYGPPAMPYRNSHGPPKLSPPTSHGEPPMSFGEPPMMISDYHPSAPSGGPYKRKSNGKLQNSTTKPPSRPTRNSYKFKLL